MNNERIVTHSDFREAEERNLEQARNSYRERATRLAAAAFNTYGKDFVSDAKPSSQDNDAAYDLPADFFMDLDFSADTFGLQNESESMSAEYLEDSNEDEAPLGEKLQVASETMQHLVNQNWLASAREYTKLQDNETAIKLMKRQQIDLMNRTKDDNLKNGLRRAIFQLDKSLEVNAARQISMTELPDSQDDENNRHHGSPESWAWVHSKEYLSHVQESHDKRLITTPYVREKLDQIISSIQNGEHIYVHGHTGGGKTELANMAAIEYKVSDEAYLAAMEDIKKTPDIKSATKSERTKMLVKSYNFHRNRLMKALEDNDPMARETLTPLHIAGSGNMTEQDLYVDKEIQLDTKDGTTGVVTKSIKKELYQAIESGRPIIIDEANAIPANVLLSMNDILTKKPGQTVFIPGAKEPVEVKRGFTVIFTGNESTAFTDYSGTAPLNPAVANRFKSVSYGYLPMSESDQYCNKQEDPAKNELFQVMVTHLADKRGNLTLRDMDNSLQKIFTFSQFVHFSQRFFAGDTDEGDYTMSTGDERELRAEGDSVLSIRNALAILDNWADNKSDRSPATLDEAIWKGFIDGLTNDNDKNTLVKIAHERFGFFSSNEGWNIGKDKNGNPKDYSPGQPGITLEEAHPGPFKSEVKELEYMPRFDVLSVLYGPRPKREFYPDEINLEDMKTEQELLEDRYNQLVDEKFKLEHEVLPILNYVNTKFPDPSLSESIAEAEAFIKKVIAMDAKNKPSSMELEQLYAGNIEICHSMLQDNIESIRKVFPELVDLEDDWYFDYRTDSEFRDKYNVHKIPGVVIPVCDDIFAAGGDSFITIYQDNESISRIDIESSTGLFQTKSMAASSEGNHILAVDYFDMAELSLDDSANNYILTSQTTLYEEFSNRQLEDLLKSICYIDDNTAVVGTTKGKLAFLDRGANGILGFSEILPIGDEDCAIDKLYCGERSIIAKDRNGNIYIIDKIQRKLTQVLSANADYDSGVLPLKSSNDLVVSSNKQLVVFPYLDDGKYSEQPFPVSGISKMVVKKLMETSDSSQEETRFTAVSNNGDIYEFRRKASENEIHLVSEIKSESDGGGKAVIMKDGDVTVFEKDGSMTVSTKMLTLSLSDEAIPQMLAIINTEGENNE